MTQTEIRGRDIYTKPGADRQLATESGDSKRQTEQNRTGSGEMAMFITAVGSDLKFDKTRHSALLG